MRKGSLAGQRILVPESRELKLFASMLEKEGATVLRCPLVTVLDLEDTEPVEAWLKRLVAGAFQDLILYTGEGVVRLMAIAGRIGMEQAVTRRLEQVRTVVRGPKPTRALRQLGLSPFLVAHPATTGGLIDALGPMDLRGRNIAVQGYPDQPPDLAEFLRSRGAAADIIVPYRYAADREDKRVVEAIRAMAEGLVDLVAFTSSPQVRRLDEVAERYALAPALAAARNRTPAAAVGPITAQALVRSGWGQVRSAEDAFHLKPLVSVLAIMAAKEALE